MQLVNINLDLPNLLRHKFTAQNLQCFAERQTEREREREREGEREKYFPSLILCKNLSVVCKVALRTIILRDNIIEETLMNNY